MNTRRLEAGHVETLKNEGDCWRSIASDPDRLRYWREIAQLWRGSLSIDTNRPARGPQFG